MVHFLVRYGDVINLLGIGSIIIVIIFLWRYQKQLFSHCPPVMLSAQPVVFQTPKNVWRTIVIAFGIIGFIVCILQIIIHFNHISSPSNSWLNTTAKVIITLLAFSFMIIGAYVKEKNNFVSIGINKIEFRFGCRSESIEAQSIQSMTSSRRVFVFFLQDGRNICLRKELLWFFKGGKLLIQLVEEFGKKTCPMQNSSDSKID